MNKELFSKKLVQLRKKHNYTQQELANKLNVSNKTVSRWETAESYPDIELLPVIASIYHVSIDYLLSDHEDYQDIDKNEIASYIPWVIAIAGILVYYIFINLSIPSLFSFAVYYFIIRFSYTFLNKYTDKKNLETLTILNTASGLFVVQSLTYKMLSLFVVYNYLSSFGIDIQTSNIDLDMSAIGGIIVTSYIIGTVYAYIHYKGHIRR